MKMEKMTAGVSGMVSDGGGWDGGGVGLTVLETLLRVVGFVEGEGYEYC